jgi:hypothetical protein
MTILSWKENYQFLILKDMKALKTVIILLTIFCGSWTVDRGLFAQNKDGFRFSDHIDKKQIDLLYNGKVLTSYCYFDSLMKPVLFPIHTVSGVTVTRGWPLEPKPGEQVDHPHHIGMWMNYESVNGIDFWNNSTAIPYNLRSKYGSIVHDGVVKTEFSTKRALLEVTARWVNHNGEIFLRETTQYSFSVKETDFIIDRVTTLTAMSNEVVFKDVKDGFFAIRVARELEQPSDKPQTYLDAQGNPTLVQASTDKTVSGEYLSSVGLKGDEVWGTRAKWVMLHGKKEGKKISITILDHSKNPGYPAYWHARGYGLFAVNPLGQEVFSKGKEKLNLTLKQNESVTFRYRVLIHEGETLGSEKIDKQAKDFNRLD